MQKVKRRSPVVVYVPVTRNGNGNGNGNGSGHSNGSGHKKPRWVPGDPIENHPLAGLAGSHKDDPTWDEYVQIMADLRREELERDLKYLDELEEQEAQSVRPGQ